MLYVKNDKFTVKTKYGNATIVIKNVKYYRGMIPCPNGKIIVNDAKRIVKEVLKKYPSIEQKLSFDVLKDIIDYLELDSSICFDAYCTASFVYSVDSDYDYHLDLYWSDWYEYPNDRNFYIKKALDDLEIKQKKEIVSRLKKIIDEIEERFIAIISEAEEALWNWIEKLKKKLEEKY